MGADRRAPRPGRAGLAALLLAAAALGACGGGDAAPEPTVPVTVVAPAARATASPGAGDPGVTIDNVVQACREKDVERLRSFVASPVDAGEIEALFARGVDVQLLSQTITAQDEASASVAVGLNVQREGVDEQVLRTWQLERGADGVWRLTALPDCF